jgi:hypothetical protein
MLSTTMARKWTTVMVSDTGPTDLERARDAVASVVRGLGGEARVGAVLALNAVIAIMEGTPATNYGDWYQTCNICGAHPTVNGTGRCPRHLPGGKRA